MPVSFQSLETTANRALGMKLLQQISSTDPAKPTPFSAGLSDVDSWQWTVQTFPLCCPPSYSLPAECCPGPALPMQCSPQPCISPACPSTSSRWQVQLPRAPRSGCWRLLLVPAPGADSVSSWFQGYLVERAGRKTLLWKSYTVMAVALGLLTVTLTLQVRPHLCIWVEHHIFHFILWQTSLLSPFPQITLQL